VDEAPTREYAAALWVLGVLPVDRVPWWAAEWLARGDDTDAIAELAGLNAQYPREIHDLLPAVFPAPPDLNAAFGTVLTRIARRYLAGELTARHVVDEVRELDTSDQPLSDVHYEAVDRVEYLADPRYGRWTPAQFADHIERTVRAACEAQVARP
jgi:hypothetical protein